VRNDRPWGPGVTRLLPWPPIDECLARLDLIDAPKEPSLRRPDPGLSLHDRGPDFMQRPIRKALLAYRTLEDNGMRCITRHREPSDRLRQGVESLDAGDEPPSAFVHLFTVRYGSILRDRMESRMPETHNAVRVSSEEPGFIFCVPRSQLTTYDGGGIRLHSGLGGTPGTAGTHNQGGQNA
jgi:hypothetical protein